MADFDPLKDYAYGDLNPLVRKGGKVYRDNGTSGLDTLKQIAGDSFKGETVLGTGPYKAICLRVESAIFGGTAPGKGASKNNWLDRIYSPIGTPPPEEFIEIKAMIPEIHGSMFPLPKSLGLDGNPADNAAISRYPTFIAKSRDIILHGVPKAGDIVWVDFGNRITLQDPIYLGPLESQLAESIALIGAGQAFDCTKGLNLVAHGGDSLGSTTTEPVSKIGPRMPPDFKITNIEQHRGKMPVGKGVFLKNQYPPPKLDKHPIAFAKKLGLSWVSPQGYGVNARKQESRVRSITKTKEFVDAYHKEGIGVYLFGWASCGVDGKRGYNEKEFLAKFKATPEDLFIKHMIEIAVGSGALGIIVDWEENAYTGKYEEGGMEDDDKTPKSLNPKTIERTTYMARRLSEECKKHRLSLGFSAGPLSRKRRLQVGIDFESWAPYCDFASPQVYSASGFWGKDHWLKGYKYFKEAGFTNIFPSHGAYDVAAIKPKHGGEYEEVGAKGPKRPKLPARMRWELHSCYSKESWNTAQWADAICWWSWDHAKLRERWKVIAELGNTTTAASNAELKSETPGKTSTATETQVGTTTDAQVGLIGPSQGATPNLIEKSHNTEVVEQKSPTANVSISQKKADIAIAANRDFAKTPITKLELIMFGGLSAMIAEKLLAQKGSLASSPDGELLKVAEEKAKKAIVEFSKKPPGELEISLLEKEILALKKQEKFLNESPGDGAVLLALSKTKKEIKIKTDALKLLNEKAVLAPTPTPTTDRPCRPLGPGGLLGTLNRAGLPAGAAVPRSTFAGGKYPALKKDELSIELPSNKRKMGINQIILHQPGNHTVKGTVNSLLAKQKPLSVHFTIDLDGTVRQHVPIERTAFHALTAKNEQNERSIGLEVINRYIPDWSKYSRGEQPIIVNPIFTVGYGMSKSGNLLQPSTYMGTGQHQGRVRAPTRSACEATWQLCKWLVSEVDTLKPADGPDKGKLVFPAIYKDKGFLWTGGGSFDRQRMFNTGIISHGRCSAGRWDGLFVEHYMACRHLGHGPAAAFNRTLSAASWTEQKRPVNNKTFTKYHILGSPAPKWVKKSENTTFEMKVHKPKKK